MKRSSETKSALRPVNVKRRYLSVHKPILGLIAVMALTAGCSAIEKQSIGEHRTPAGNSVNIGQFKPDSEHKCIKKKTEKVAWGMRQRMNVIGAMSNVNARAAKNADKYRANYVYLKLPRRSSINGVSFGPSKAILTYYRCTNRPS